MLFSLGQSFSIRQFSFSIRQFSFSIRQLSFSIRQLSFSIRQFCFSIRQFSFSICQFSFSIRQFSFSIRQFSFSICQFSFLYANFVWCRQMFLVFWAGLWSPPSFVGKTKPKFLCLELQPSQDQAVKNASISHLEKTSGSWPLNKCPRSCKTRIFYSKNLGLMFSHKLPYKAGTNFFEKLVRTSLKYLQFVTLRWF